MSREFKMGNLNITFTDEFQKYNELKKTFEDIAFDASEKFKSLYKSNCSNIDEVHNNGLNLGYSCISESIDNAIAILISNDLMHIDKNNFIDKYYAKYLTWEETFEEVDFKYAKIVLSDEEEKQYRSERKDCRGRWQGGGFGISGALTGGMKAGAMNLATGAAHSTFNFFGNMMTTANTNTEKERLFNDENTLITLVSGVYNNVFSITYALVDALRNNGITDVSMYTLAEDASKATALLNNLKNGLIPTEKRESVIENIIYSDPYNEEIYLHVLENYGDDDRGIESITEFLSVDIEDGREKVLSKYYSKLSKKTEQDTLESIELFKKYAKSINIDDISEYLKKFDEILVQHDINIRTIDNVLFETREAAEVARSEYNEILEIKSKIVTFTEKSLTDAIKELESKEHKTCLKEKHLKDLNIKLVETIRLEEQVFLNDNYAVSTITTEEIANNKLSALKDITLRNMDILEQRISEIEEKRIILIEESDRNYIEDFYSSLVMLNERQVSIAIESLNNISIRTTKIKEEKINYIHLKAEKIIKKHNDLLEKASKYEVRMNTIKEEKVEPKKGFFGFISKTIEKGGALIDGIQEKREKEAWDFITNNGTRTIDSVRNL